MPALCQTELELILVIDASGSMNPERSRMREVLRSVHRQFELALTLTRIGMVEFSRSGSVIEREAVC